MTSSPFRPRTVLILVLLAGTSLLAMFLLLALGSEFESVTSANPDSFSRSALGHRAFAEMLREMDVPVVVSQGRTAEKLASSSVLVLAEPPPVRDDSLTYDMMRALLEQSRRTLIVLPKREVGDLYREGAWARSVQLRATGSLDEVLRELRIAGRVVRPGPVAWTTNALGVEPTLVDPQVLADSNLVPLVTTRAGVLIGEIRGGEGRVLVLSDPDILATHGLGKGANASLAYRVIENLRDGEGVVVFDETHHGYSIVRSVWAELFRFPLVLVILHLAATLGVLLWASLERFGGIQPSPPELRPGLDALIGNTAELLLRGRHAPRMLARYFGAAQHIVAESLHAPRDLDAKARRAWLASVGERRGVSIAFESLIEEVRAATRTRRFETGRVTGAARRIHRWKTEILHGRADRRS